MGTVQFRNGVVLFGDSDGNNTDKVAMHEDCCCEEDCGQCLGGKGPAQFQVQISGLTNQNCEACQEDLNGVFVLDFIEEDIPLAQCLWGYQTSGDCAELLWLFLSVAEVGGKWYVRVHYGTSKADFRIKWEKEYDSKPDCINLASEVIPFDNEWSLNCDLPGEDDAIVTAL